MHANLNDRASLETIYPRADFEHEAQANSAAKAEVLHGIRIDSTPDADGGFELTRAARQIGEDDTAVNSLFLAPFSELAAIAGDRSGGDPAAGASGPPPGGYDAFIDKIRDAARGASFEKAPDPGDVRLKGPRQ